MITKIKCCFIALILLCQTLPVYALSGLEDSLQISATGVLVQKFRLRLIAENMANLVTLKTETGLPYQKKYTILEPSKMGVKIKEVARSNEPFSKYFDPTVPQSDASGFFYFPNVNLPDEYVDLAFTEVVYEANITSFKSAKAMYQQSLELLK